MFAIKFQKGQPNVKKISIQKEYRTKKAKKMLKKLKKKHGTDRVAIFLSLLTNGVEAFEKEVVVWNEFVSSAEQVLKDIQHELKEYS